MPARHTTTVALVVLGAAGMVGGWADGSWPLLVGAVVFALGIARLAERFGMWERGQT